MQDFNLDMLLECENRVLLYAQPDQQLIMNQDLPLDKNPAAVYLAKLKKNSRRPQKDALDTVARILSRGKVDCINLDWSRIRYHHSAYVRSCLLDNYAPATANRVLCALRGALEQAWLLGLMSTDDYYRAIHLSPILGETLPAGRVLSEKELEVLFQDCKSDSRKSGIRDAAILAILYAGGLRREEISKLDFSDYDGCKKLIVQGKRSKERLVYLADGAANALALWLKIRGTDAGPLFIAINKGGNMLYGKRMTPQAIYYLVKSRAKRAGLETFSPHDLRRTFVGDLLDAGVDIVTVARMAGHADIETTARYDRRPERVKQLAADLLYIPV